MIFKLAEAAEKSWRRLDGHNQLPKVILGAKFFERALTCRPCRGVRRELLRVPLATIGPSWTRRCMPPKELRRSQLESRPERVIFDVVHGINLAILAHSFYGFAPFQ